MNVPKLVQLYRRVNVLVSQASETEFNSDQKHKECSFVRKIVKKKKMIYLSELHKIYKFIFARFDQRHFAFIKT